LIRPKVDSFVAAFHGRFERATEGTSFPPVQRTSNLFFSVTDRNVLEMAEKN